MKKTALAALALSAALGLGACGDAGDGPAAQKPSGSSSAAASGSRSAATVDGGELAARMTAAMVEAGSGTVVMDLGTGAKATGSFAVTGGETQQQLTAPIQGRTMQLVSTGGVIYLKGVPGSTKPWVRVDPEGDDPMSQMLAGLVGDLGDPRQLAMALAGARATVVSSTTSTTTYDVTIDPQALLGGAAAGAPPALQPVKARITLDAQDRPTALAVAVQGRSVTVAFGDWGKPVSIKAPPADQVGVFQLPTS